MHIVTYPADQNDPSKGNRTTTVRDCLATGDDSTSGCRSQGDLVLNKNIASLTRNLRFSTFATPYATVSCAIMS